MKNQGMLDHIESRHLQSRGSLDVCWKFISKVGLSLTNCSECDIVVSQIKRVPIDENFLGKLQSRGPVFVDLHRHQHKPFVCTVCTCD